MNKKEKRIKALGFYRDKLKEAREEEAEVKKRGKFYEGYNKATQTVLECVIAEFAGILD